MHPHTGHPTLALTWRPHPREGVLPEGANPIGHPKDSEEVHGDIGGVGEGVEQGGKDGGQRHGAGEDEVEGKQSCSRSKGERRTGKNKGEDRVWKEGVQDYMNLLR